MTFSVPNRIPAASEDRSFEGVPRAWEIFGPMVEHFGWELYQAEGFLAVGCPYSSLGFRLDLRRKEAASWELEHRIPHWFAQFSRHTPVEALGLMVYSLPQLQGDTRFAESIGFLPTGVSEAAADARWAASRTPGGIEFASPDGHSSLRYMPRSIGIHTMWAFRGYNTEHNRAWEARFTQGTPAPLVARFLTTLTTTATGERRTPLGGATPLPALETALTSGVRR
ncbi:DUF317 domain-containing protein [Streptomyces sp. NPDC088745]|uniref:DUF317 domain-containing protein n=1 Tax=Streptomyces sp. NPDC088745 TaxID=3365884 RepID=UPI0037FBE88A